MSIKLRILLFLIASITTIALNVSTPLVLFHLVNYLSNLPTRLSTSNHLLIGSSFAAIWITSRIVDQMRSMLLGGAVWQATTLLITKYIKKILSLPLEFHHTKKIGGLISQLQKAENAISNLIWQFAIYVIPTAIEVIIASYIIYIKYGVIFLLGVIITLASYMLFTSFLLKYSVRAQHKSREVANDSYNHLGDMLLNYETIKLLNSDQTELNKARAILIEKEKALTKRMLVSESIMLGQKVIIGIGLLFLSLLAVNQVIQGHFNISDFILIISYVLQFYNPLSSMTSVLREIMSAIVDLQDVRCIFSLKNTMEIGNNQLLEFPPAIDFRNVSFSYDVDKLVLKNITFKIAPGEKIAIVGQSGAGKSTLLKLLYRFYDATEGTIEINNIAIHQYDIENLRSKIGIVPQDIVLFNDTLYCNLTYGLKEVCMTKLNTLLIATGLNQLIKTQADGLNTIVGERGLKLSGGEKQRIAIIRTLLKDPILLIFDEATSALDACTMQLIQELVDAYFHKMTMIVITHRLISIQHLDRIFVLDDGKIIETGRHQELISLNGSYYKQWVAQKVKESA